MKDIEDNLLTITLEGMPANDGHVLFEDFNTFSENLRKLLNLLHPKKEGKKKNKYRIIAASHNSPLTITIESNISKIAKPIKDLNLSVRNTKEKILYDYAILKAYHELIKGYGKKFNLIKLNTESEQVAYNNIDVKHSAKVIETNYYAYGSVTGRLDKLNIHKKNSSFTIYPLLADPINCKIPEEKKYEVSQYVGRRVTMHGKISYSAFSDFPISIVVNDVELIPFDNELPKSDEIKGLMPDLTGDLTIEEYIEENRKGYSNLLLNDNHKKGSSH